MRLFLTVFIVSSVLLSAWHSAANAQAAVIVISLNVANLHPYTADTQYMSIVGYYRTLVHRQTGVWLSYEAANRLIEQLKRH